jgi:hypothetical protein
MLYTEFPVVDSGREVQSLVYRWFCVMYRNHMTVHSCRTSAPFWDKLEKQWEEKSSQWAEL